MIPKIFHWVWIGSKPFPEQYREWMRGWLRAHPDWSVKFWTNDNLFTLTNQALFDACPCIAAKCNLLRIEAVLRFGGLYLDTDFECVRNADHLLTCDPLLVEEYPGVLDTAVFGASRDHPFMQHMTDMALPIYEENRNPNRSLSHATSRSLVNTCRATWRTPLKTITDQRVFYPRVPSAETVGIHHRTRSWFWQTPGAQMPMYQSV